MSDDFKLLAKLAADTTDFDSAMKRSSTEARQWATEAKAIFLSTRTPLEQYQAAVERVHEAWRAGHIDTDTFGRALAKLRGEFEKTTTVMADLVSAKGSPFAPGKASAFAGLGGALSSSLLGFTTGVGAIVSGAMLATRAIEGLAHAATGAAAQGLKLAADFEQAEIAFGTVFKSATAAKQVMRDIQQFAAATPFEFPELKDAAVKLAGFGTSSKQLLPTLKMLGDIASGTGTTVGELAETYGKARVQGRAYTRDVNEFANRGVPIWDALAKTLNTTKDKIHGMVEEGQVGFPELQRALLSLTEAGGMYEGATERQSQTLAGLYSTLRDNINLSLAGIGESLVKELSLKDVTRDAIELTGAFQTELVPVIAEMAKGMKILGETAIPVINAFTGIDISTKGLKETMFGAHATLLQWRLAMANIVGTSEQVAEIQQELVNLGVRASGIGGANTGKLEIETDTGKQARDLAESIASVNAKLKEEIATFGMSADEKQIWKLKSEGATEEMIRQTRALAAQHEAQKKAVESAKEMTKAQKKAADDAAKAAKKQEDAQASLIKSLEGKLASLKGESVQNQLQQFEKEFGAGSVSQRAKDLQAQIDAAEKQKKLQKELADARKKDADEAKRIIEETRTPYEKYAEEIYKIERLWKQGELTQEQAIRAAKKAQGEFLSSGPEYTSENKAILRGSSEAFSTANRAKDRRKQEKVAEDQLSTLKRMEILSRQSVAAQQSVQRWESN